MLKFHALRVAELHPDADDAIGVALDVPADLRSEYTGLPGQHIVLRTKLEGEEVRRTYSLINTPGEWPLRIVARVHRNGLMSRHLADQVKVGDSIDVLPPNGSLTIRRSESAPADESGRTYVGFASGCGITPVLSIIKSVLRADNTSRFTLFYGNSGVGRTMCLEELLGLKNRYLERLALHFVMSREPQEVELYNGRLDADRVRELARTFFAPGQVDEYFVCGPGDMIGQVSAALQEMSVSVDRIHEEHFTLTTVGGGAAEDSAGNGASAFVGDTDGHAREAIDYDGSTSDVTVVIDGRRRTFTMRMNDETVLDAAARAGLDLPFSCRAGVCSTCRTKVVAGEVEMAGNYALEEWELAQGYVLACQSRAKTARLELDYDEK
jgi:ring-1,2-phenylacetyl-CoA epoxidase subunit PaaE